MALTMDQVPALLAPNRMELVRASSGVVPPIYGRVGPGLMGCGPRPCKIGEPAISPEGAVCVQGPDGSFNYRPPPSNPRQLELSRRFAAAHDPLASSPEQVALLARAVRRPPVNAAPPLLQDLDRDQLAPTTRLGRVLRNYNARAVSRRGGIMPAYATRTGDIPLPDPIRYDPMGYTYALGPEPEWAEITPAAEFVFDETPVTMAGFGEAASETPEVRQLPWQIDEPPSAAVVRAQLSEKRWQRAAVLIGVLGGTLGIILSWKALKGRRS